MASGEPPEVASLTPDRYSEIPVEDLLQAAARGQVGVDRRLVQSILDRGESAAPDVVRFARIPRKDHRVDLDPLMVDLFRYFRPPEALEFYIDAIRHYPEDVDDDLIQAFLPFGEKAIDPLLALYEELGEEQGSDVAFLIAGLRVRDARVLSLLLDRLEYDAADGAFCLGLYGDAAARPALEKMFAEIPAEDADLRRELAHAIEELDAPEPRYEPEAFDILTNYSRQSLPEFDVLSEEERIEMLSSGDAAIRAGAAHSFFNSDLNAKARATLLTLATSDAEGAVRGRAWESLASAAEEPSVRDALIAALTDESKPVEERGGAAVGLFGLADRDDVRAGIEALYAMGGLARAKALEAMWRSLWEPYAKYFAQHLDDTDESILRQALRGAGYFRLTNHADKIAKFFHSETHSELREDALFAYALAMPGETTRGRAKGMLRKIDSLATLTPDETDLVMFALDERLRLHGLAPVFTEEETREKEPEPAPAAEVPKKIGRNDPCPCGSGKKFKKCCGAA